MTLGFKEGFQPGKFDPDQWAKAGKDAGMKYVVFTTNIMMDSACLIPSKRISRSHQDHLPIIQEADVAKYVFDAFRRNGFMIGAIFLNPIGIANIAVAVICNCRSK
jgi:alpha-L-fucosidase